MVTSVAELVQRGLASPQLAASLHHGDWYLVGSRSTGLADELSDWDTVLVTDHEVLPVTEAALDAAFSVHRPALDGAPTLTFHGAWRAAGAVELDVLGPAARSAPDRRDSVPWAHSMRHAQLLNLAAGIGEDYRRQVAAGFARHRPDAMQHSYVRYRLSRNEAVSALARPDEATALLLAGRCATQAARFWLLADEEPYPSDKWLLRTLAEASPTGAELLRLIRVTLDAASSAADRFDAHWEMWRAVDRRARAQQISVG